MTQYITYKIFILRDEHKGSSLMLARKKNVGITEAKQLEGSKNSCKIPKAWLL